METNLRKHPPATAVRWLAGLAIVGAIGLIVGATWVILRTNELRRAITAPASYSGGERQAIRLIPELQQQINRLRETVTE